jgi:hypothetical protein
MEADRMDEALLDAKTYDTLSIDSFEIATVPAQKDISLIITILLSTIEVIGSLRVYLPGDLKRHEHREVKLWKCALAVHRRLLDGIPLLDCVQDMEIMDEKFTTLVNVCIHMSFIVVHVLT